MEDTFANFVGLSRPKEEISMWVEKYRPKSLDEFIGNESFAPNIREYINRKELTNHILLYGPQGTGKTSIAKLLIKNIPCDSLLICASDETGVENIRDKVRGFASSVGFERFKVVLLDEADFLSFNAQGMLRNVLEKFADHCRFIFTCNYIYKVIPAIQSRCQKFEVIPGSKKDEMIRLAEILTNEKVTFKPEDVAFIVNQYHPDMRSIIQFAQQCSISGELKIIQENLIESNAKSKLIEMLKSPNKKTFVEIRQMIADSGISEFDDLYTYLYDNVSKFANGRESVAVVHIAESVYQSSLVIPAAREITFMALVNKLITDLG